MFIYLRLFFRLTDGSLQIADGVLRATVQLVSATGGVCKLTTSVSGAVRKLATSLTFVTLIVGIRTVDDVIPDVVDDVIIWDRGLTLVVALIVLGALAFGWIVCGGWIWIVCGRWAADLETLP